MTQRVFYDNKYQFIFTENTEGWRKDCWKKCEDGWMHVSNTEYLSLESVLYGIELLLDCGFTEVAA